jgi:hypothetical protein
MAASAANISVGSVKANHQYRQSKMAEMSGW